MNERLNSTNTAAVPAARETDTAALLRRAMQRRIAARTARRSTMWAALTPSQRAAQRTRTDAQFAFFAAVPENADYRILMFVPAISRCGSSLAVTVLKPMNTSQYAAQKKPKSHVAVLLAMTAAFLAAGFLLCGRYGFVLLGGMAGYSLALRKAYKSLEGMNGDISGYALTISELCAGAVFAIL